MEAVWIMCRPKIFVLRLIAGILLFLPAVSRSEELKRDSGSDANGAHRAGARQAEHARQIGKPIIETNSLGMKLVLIPPGEFLMGTPAKDADKVHKQEFTDADGKVVQLRPLTRDNETPQHPVRITKAFYLGQHEVTRGQFRKFVRTTKYRTDGEKNRWTPYSWRSADFAQTDNHPVISVSWNDAVAFCEWLSKVEGASYRLPTEAEWEYACRAGSTADFCFGDESEDLVRYGNVLDDTAREKLSHVPWLTFLKGSDGHYGTSPVGLFRPNAFRLYDMHGNLFEWCTDYYAADYYAQSLTDDPQGPIAGEDRVVRSGFYGGYPHHARSAYRSNRSPNGGSWMGFRVVQVAQP